MIDFVRISLVVLGTTLGISIIVIIAMEAGVRELLKITEQYKFMKITYLLLAVKRTAYAMIFTILSTIVVILLSILFEKKPFWPDHPLFLQIIIISLISLSIYSMFFNQEIKRRFDQTENKVNMKIDKWLSENFKKFAVTEFALTTQEENQAEKEVEFKALIEKNNLVNKMMVVYLDSLVLLMTGLGLLLTTSVVSPFMFKEDGTFKESYILIFILAFISVIISKFHANHENVENKAKLDNI